MFIISIIALIVLFVVNILFGIKYGFGFRHYWFFEFEHSWGGFFIAMFLANFTDSLILIFVGLGIASFIWELMEYLIARFKKSKNYMKKTFHIKNVQPEWKDTTLDIILNFSGAIVFIVVKTLLS